LYRPYTSSLALLWEIVNLHKSHFSWKEPPYEYEHVRQPIDLITGDFKVREWLDKGVFFEPYWKDELKNYLEWRKSYLLYD
jgi:hypothetical protein